MMTTPLHITRIGGGSVIELPDGGWEMHLPAGCERYADAQIDDHRALPRNKFRWSPPLRMTLQARVSRTPAQGTFGFGFWNDPFAISLGQSGAARRLPSAPHACWFFFGAPPHDLALTPGVEGSGWKAQTLRGPSLPGLLLLPAAAGALLLTRIPGLRRPLIKLGVGMLSVDEGMLHPPPEAWHTYQIDWKVNEVTFSVDDAIVLRSNISPRPPLGFIAWIDNQYAVVSPEKGIRFGVRPTHASCSLYLRDMRIDPLDR